MAGGNFSSDGMMSEINVTPLVDVMLVLLVVFIVTAPLLSPQALKINLPKTEAVAPAEQPQHLHLTVDAQGALQLDGVELDDAQLAWRLHERAADPQFQLQIEADQAVPYGRIAGLMAVAQHAGVAKLSFVTLAGN